MNARASGQCSRAIPVGLSIHVVMFDSRYTYTRFNYDRKSFIPGSVPGTTKTY